MTQCIFLLLESIKLFTIQLITISRYFIIKAAVNNNSTIIEKKEIARIFCGFAQQAQKQLSEKMNEKKKRVIVIAGPTACGKSSFGFSLADLCFGEIISADSMQVYRGMDIGTAKPTSQERELYAHHLVDVRDIQETYNVVDFYYEARQSCQLVHAADHTPIVVGGSGFYLHSLIYGPPSGPPSVPELRKLLEDEADQLGTEVLFERLKKLDPQYASTITCHDKQKIVRGLEIVALTGKKISKLPWKNRCKPQNYDFRCWFLHRPREVLYERINTRCDQMLAAGFLDEVAALDKKGLRENTSAAQAIGYRQALQFLDSNQTKADYLYFVEKFKQSSRNFAKRQFTWFRNEPMFRWLDLELHDPEVALELVRQDYESL